MPLPLPPDPPVVLTEERQRRLERAVLACGQLDSITTLLPDPALFLYSYVRREAVLSSQIEGTQSSLSDLLLYEIDEIPGVPQDDVEEVSCYVAALEHGLQRLRDDFPLTSRLIREIHQILLSSGRGADKRPGEFRTTQNWIGGARPSTARFVPPPPFRVGDCMADLDRFVNTATTSGLIKAALAHVQFETIHPFLDGNGRTGRLLIALILHAEGILAQPLLYLSLYFRQHRSLYYDLLDKVRRTGDWEAWLDFFLDGVQEVATAAIALARAIRALFEADALLLPTSGQTAGSSHRIFTHLQRHPVTTVNRAADATGMSRDTANTTLGRLQRLGIVAEVTGRRRDRVFTYRRYLALLADSTAPASFA